MAKNVIKFVVKNKNAIDTVAQVSKIKEISVTKDNYLELVELRKEIKSGKTLVEKNGKVIGFVPRNALEKFEEEQEEIVAKVDEASIKAFYDGLTTKLADLNNMPLTGNVDKEIKKLEKKIKIFERDFSPVVKKDALDKELDELKEQSKKLNDEINEHILNKDIESSEKKKIEKTELDAKIAKQEQSFVSNNIINKMKNLLLTKADRNIKAENKEELNALYKEMLSKEKDYVEKPLQEVKVTPIVQEEKTAPIVAPIQELKVTKKKTNFFEGLLFKIKKTGIKEAAISKKVVSSMKKNLKKKLNVPFNEKKYLEVALYNLNKADADGYKNAKYFYELILENVPDNIVALAGLEHANNEKKMSESDLKKLNDDELVRKTKLDTKEVTQATPIVQPISSKQAAPAPKQVSPVVQTKSVAPTQTAPVQPIAAQQLTDSQKTDVMYNFMVNFEKRFDSQEKELKFIKDKVNKLEKTNKKLTDNLAAEKEENKKLRSELAEALKIIANANNLSNSNPTK